MDSELVDALLNGQRPATTKDISAWVAALDAIPAGAPEGDHWAADRVLLQAVPPEVRAAYERARARRPWWASSG